MIRDEADRTRYVVAEGIWRADHIMEENELRQREPALDPERNHVGGQLIKLLVGRMAHAPIESGVIRDATGRVIQISGVDYAPFSGQKYKPKSREQASLLAKYDQVFNQLDFRLAFGSEGLMGYGELNPRDVFALDVRGDTRFQAVLAGIGLQALPILLVKKSGQEIQSNIVHASTFSRIETDRRFTDSEQMLRKMICLDTRQCLGVYRKIYLPEPTKKDHLSWVDIDGWRFPSSTATKWMNEDIRLGSLEERSKGFSLEGVMLLTISPEKVYIDNVRLPIGWRQFFYRSGSMFTKDEVQKLQDALVGSKQLSYAPTARELELVSTLESHPQAALERIKGEVGKYPDPAFFRLRRGEKAACFGRDDIPNVRMGIGTRDKLTVVLAGLDVRQLAKLVSEGEFHFSALDKCLLGGRDSLVLQASSPESGEIVIKAAVVRLVEGKDQYADSLASSRVVIEGFRSSCPGFSIDILRQAVSNALGKRSALAYIISQLQSFEEQLLSQRAKHF